ncbi:hypothetical protein [Devosia limi]|uniref:hypothetical protein n=1 Tax=Devosia limi TaxID=288995 RepID=UPI0011604B98|nr:hypothetical protein [Devosia limi]
MSDIDHKEGFTFTSRPVPVPGDLRITWRISVLLMMLSASRADQASLAKLNIISAAVNSTAALNLLEKIIAGGAPTVAWKMGVEPALGRAVDLLVGDGLAKWKPVSGRAGVVLTVTGKAACSAIIADGDVLSEEKSIIKQLAKITTETLVSSIISL